MDTQKAWRLHSYGGPETMKLDDIPIPKPGSNQVLVAVSKAAVNPFDWKIRKGYVKDQMPLPLPAVLGVDFVGTVVAVGDKTSRLHIGDRVMTMSTSLGAFAEHIVVNEEILGRVPDNLDDEAAATLPIPGLTAWQTLYAAGNVEPGSNILIHGASGVVGALATQFAKAAGAKVIGTASAKNRDFVLSLGADEFVDYQTEKFEDRVKDVDLVLDYVLVGGTDNTTARSWKVLKPNGAIATAADPMILASTPPGYRGFFPSIQPDASRLEAMAAQLAKGSIKTKVARVFPLDQLVDAMAINEAGGTTGRLLIDFKRS